MSSIKKAHRIVGNNLTLHNATPDYAQFVLSLRIDPVKGRHLSPVLSEITSQIRWLESYSNDENQAYFIIVANRSPCGTVRIYDAKGDSFCWGSWLLINDSPSNFAIESALIIYEFALALGFSSSHFDVRKANLSVWKFHERFGAKRVSENDLDFFYTIDLQSITASLAKYRKYLPNGINIEW